MTKHKKGIIWAIWLITLPIYAYFFIDYGVPVIREQWVAFLSFLCLMLVTSWFPIRFRHTNIVPLHGITLAIFLQFGLVVEILVMQLAIMTSLLSLKLTKAELYRYPLNSIVFLSVSLVAAGSFYLFGGTTGILIENQLQYFAIPIISYAFVYFFFNNWLIFAVRKYFVKIKDNRFFDDALAWEALSSVLIVPVGVTLYLLYQEIGFLAVFLIGLPLISISLFLKLYNESERTGKLLKKISAFGYEINDTLSVEKIYRLFTETVPNIFSLDEGYLYDAEDGKIKLIKDLHASNQSSLSPSDVDGISKRVLKEGKSRLFTNIKEWEKYDPDELFKNSQSVMSVPFMRNHEVVGVITLMSTKKKAYEKRHLMLLEIMVNYFVVAIQNARNFEKTKNENERCGLTKLYNFRYFENLLLSKYESPTNNEEFAIILLDLDHFKRINDTFGHHSGNEVLCQVAQVLKGTVGESGIVARYGGEEFVVLVEGDNVQYAEKIAEALRREIESHLFIVSEDIKGGRERKPVRITASIGVAEKIEVGESPMSVLRNADRAMYTGAKQQGRNKVSHF